MSTDLAISEGKLPLVMKSGQVHWISPELHAKLAEQLASQSGHMFIRLREIDNAVINSAEVEGVYSLEQYADSVKVKQGMWQCEYRTWHERKNICDCKREWHEKHERELKRIRETEENKPMTDEEKAESREHLRLGNEEAALGRPSSIFREMYKVGNRGDRTIRRSTIEAWEAKHGPVDTDGLAIEEGDFIKPIIE